MTGEWEPAGLGSGSSHDWGVGSPQDWGVGSPQDWGVWSMRDWRLGSGESAGYRMTAVYHSVTTASLRR